MHRQLAQEEKGLHSTTRLSCDLFGEPIDLKRGKNSIEGRYYPERARFERPKNEDPHYLHLHSGHLAANFGYRAYH